MTVTVNAPAWILVSYLILIALCGVAYLVRTLLALQGLRIRERLAPLEDFERERN